VRLAVRLFPKGRASPSVRRTWREGVGCAVLLGSLVFRLRPSGAAWFVVELEGCRPFGQGAVGPCRNRAFCSRCPSFTGRDGNFFRLAPYPRWWTRYPGWTDPHPLLLIDVSQNYLAPKIPEGIFY